MPPDLFFDNVFICFFSPEKSPYYTFANAKKQVDNLKNLFPQNMRLYVKIIYGAAHGIVVRGGVTYVVFAVSATYRMDGGERYDFTIRIMIPLDMVKA